MRAVKLFILIIASSAILSACSKPSKKIEKPSTVTQTQENSLPAIFIRTLDDEPIAVKTLSVKKTILILFQPDCDHCQNEARQIRENITAFKSYEVYFITAAKKEEAKTFSIDFKFDSLKNFHFATTDVQSILNSYGPVQTPSVYIYLKGGKLQRQFNGQTEIGTILKAIEII